MRRPDRSSAFPLLAGAALLCVACGPSRPGPARYAGHDAREFVQKHRAELQAEIAVGSGPRVYDLAIIANCQDVGQLGRGLHRRQDQIFAPAGSSSSDTPSGSRSVGGNSTGADPSAGLPGAGLPDSEFADRVVRFMQNSRDLRCLSLDLSRTGDLAGGRRYIGPRRSQVARRGGGW